MFRAATKEQTYLRMAIYGPSGAGKTYSALRIAGGLGGRVGVIDTEHRSAAKYADRFSFDVAELSSDRGIEMVISGLAAAAEAGYEVVIIDSLSHAWQGLLEEVDKLAAKYRGSTWQAWSEGTPKQRRLVEALLSYPGHLIATMRSKTEWVVSNEGGRAKPVRVGLAPEQGKGIEYEFDLLLELTADHVAHVIKDRTGRFQGRMIERPDEAFGQELAGWFSGQPVALLPPVPLPNGQADTPAGKALRLRSGFALEGSSPKGQASGPTLSPERVEGLRRELSKLGVGDHYALAAQTLGRPVASLAELTEAEARLVWNKARKGYRPPPEPVSDEAAAAVLG